MKDFMLNKTMALLPKIYGGSWVLAMFYPVRRILNFSGKSIEVRESESLFTSITHPAESGFSRKTRTAPRP